MSLREGSGVPAAGDSHEAVSGSVCAKRARKPETPKYENVHAIRLTVRVDESREWGDALLASKFDEPVEEHVVSVGSKYARDPHAVAGNQKIILIPWLQVSGAHVLRADLEKHELIHVTPRTLAAIAEGASGVELHQAVSTSPSLLFLTLEEALLEKEPELFGIHLRKGEKKAVLCGARYALFNVWVAVYDPD